jgi:hypothetical protein
MAHKTRSKSFGKQTFHSGRHPRRLCQVAAHRGATTHGDVARAVSGSRRCAQGCHNVVKPPNRSKKYFHNAVIPPNRSEKYFHNVVIPSNRSEKYFHNAVIPSNRSEKYFHNAVIPPNRPEKYFHGVVKPRLDALLPPRRVFRYRVLKSYQGTYLKRFAVGSVNFVVPKQN